MTLRSLRFLALLLPLCLAACSGAEAEVPSIAAKPLPLDPETPERTSVGQLVYRGGLLLTSSDRRLGGLSGLVVSPDGTRFLAVSDEGYWVSAELAYDLRGFLSDVKGARFGELLDESGQPLSASKRSADAEAATLAADGSLLVAFERQHRILAYPLQDFVPAGLPRRFEAPAHPEGSNGGVEALTSLPDGRLLAFSERLEGRRQGVATRLAFLAEGPGAPWQALDLAKPDSLAPVDAATLPDGDVLLLERRWSPFPGLAIRLSRIAGASLEPGGYVVPERLAFLAPPLNIDNMEGLAVRRDSEGRLLVYLLSDDNFNLLQRTLLLLFEVEEGRHPS